MGQWQVTSAQQVAPADGNSPQKTRSVAAAELFRWAGDFRMNHLKIYRFVFPVFLLMCGCVKHYHVVGNSVEMGVSTQSDDTATLVLKTNDEVTLYAIDKISPPKGIAYNSYIFGMYAYGESVIQLEPGAHILDVSYSERIGNSIVSSNGRFTVSFDFIQGKHYELVGFTVRDSVKVEVREIGNH